MSVFRIEFLPVGESATQRAMAGVGASTDRLTVQFDKTVKAAVDLQEQTLRVEAAQRRATVATAKYGAESLQAAKANTALARAVVGVASAEERLAVATKANAAGYAVMANRLKGAGGALSSFGHRLTTTSTLIAGIGVVSGKMSVDFNAAMERVHTQAGASQREVDRLRGRVLALAKVMPQSPQQLAEGLYHLESIGLRGARAMDALKTAALGAAVGNSNLEDTASALGGAWLTNIKGAGNLHHTMGLLNATVGAGNMRMDELVQALGTGILPAAKVAGLGIKDVLSALAVFTDENIQGSSATAQLATALHFLYAPTQKATTAMKTIGLGSSQLAVDLHKPQGLMTALTDLQNHLDGMSRVRQERILGSILPGGRGRILLVLLNQLDRYQQKLDQVGKTSSRFGEAVRKTQETPLYKLKSAWSSVQVSLIQFGDRLIPVVVPIFEKLAGGIDRLGTAFGHLPHSWQTVVVGGALLVAALGPVSIGVGSLVKNFGALTGAYGSVIAWSQKVVVANQQVAASEAEVAAAAGIAARTTATRYAAPVAATSAGGLILPPGVRSVAPVKGTVPVISGPGFVAGPAAEEAAVARASLGRRLVGFGARGLRGAGIAGVGMMGAQFVGAAVGGGTGHAIGGIGNGAALGAGLGSVVPGIGTVTGAAVGAVAGFDTQARSIANSKGKYRGFDLPTSGGGFKSMMRDMEHWSFEQPKWETKARKLGDTIQGLNGSFRTLDSSSLRRLAHDARQAGANFDPARRALDAFARDADRNLGARFGRALNGLARGPRFQSVQTFIAPIENQLRELPKRMRNRGSSAIVALALGMEQSGRLPKGATDQIIKQMRIGWEGLDPYLRAQVAKTMRHVSRGLSDRIVVDSVQKQVNAIGNTWGDAPRLARVGARNASITWQIEMDYLRRKLKTTTGEQRDEAQRLFDVLQAMGTRPADVTKRAYDRLERQVRTGWRKLADFVNNTPLIAPGTSLLPGPNSLAPTKPKKAKRRRVGGEISSYQDGGLVPAYVSSGEEIVYGNSSWTVPGPRMAADNVFTMLPVGAAVLTDHGQQLASAGMPLGAVLANQAPHFREGGPVQRLRPGGTVKRSIGWTRIGATVYDDPPPGAFGSLDGGFAELGTATRGKNSRATGRGWLARAFGLPGELPAHAAIDFALGNRVVTLKKQDRGYGQGGDGTTSDSHYAADIWKDSWSKLGINGSWSGSMLARPHKGSVSGLTSFSYIKQPAIARPRMVDILQPYGAPDAFQQGFDFASSPGNGSRLFKTPTGVDSDLFKSATSGAKPNKRDLPQRIVVKGTGANLKRKGAKLSFPLPPGTWQPGRVDQGWDLTAPAHTPLLAVGAGKVAGHGISGFGNWAPILKLNSGRSVYYGHAGPGRAVAVGRSVRAGQIVGEVGAGRVGISTGPHLEIGYYPPGSMGAGSAMKRALGYRSGGIVQAFRRGGRARHRHTNGPPLRSALDIVRSSDTGGGTDVVRAMRDFGALIDEGTTVGYHRLVTIDTGIRDEIRRLAKGGLTGRERVQVRRLRGVITLLEAEMGKRVGSMVASAQRVADSVGRRQTSLSRRLAIRGVSEDSMQGIGTLMEADTGSLSVLQGALGTSRAALRRARKRHDPAAVQAIKDQIGSIQDQIGDTQVSLAERRRALAHAQRYDPLNAQLALDQLSGNRAAQLNDLNAERGLLASDLADATRRHDYQAMQDLAGQLQSVNSSIDDLTQATEEQNRIAQEQMDLNRQLIDNQNRILAVATSQPNVLLGAITAALNGSIGGRIGLGFQTPGYAGGPARY